tara:strand:+ start:3766 stop:4683 length:918 start_codon:yes stop_codon:yes gene_type:complete
MKKIRQQFAETVLKIGKKDKNIVVMVGDISHGIMQPFAKNNPRRYFNIGICEPAMVNVAAGISKMGLIPIVHTITPFLIERSFEQIKLDFGYQKLPVNLVSVGDTFDYSKLGCSHHSYSDLAMISQFNNSQFVYPGSAEEFDILFNQAYRQKKINYFRISDFSHSFKFSKNKIKLGKGIKFQKGKDLTIICTANFLNDANLVSENLKKEKKTTEIIYLHTIKPIDKNLIIKSVKKTKKVLILDKFNFHSGLANICINLLKDLRNIKIESISINDFIHDYGSYENLKNKAGFSQKNIMLKISKLFR